MTPTATPAARVRDTAATAAKRTVRATEEVSDESTEEEEEEEEDVEDEDEDDDSEVLDPAAAVEAGGALRCPGGGPGPACTPEGTPASGSGNEQMRKPFKLGAKSEGGP